MKIRTFKGYENVYPEKIDGTTQWYYGQCTPCAECYEVLEFCGNYPGTRLYLFCIDGSIYEPVKQEKNVFLERPVYNIERESLGFIRYDFRNEKMQLIEFQIKTKESGILTELPLSKAGDMINVRIVTDPYMVVKHNIHDDTVDFLWPIEKRYQFEENESLDFVHDNKLFTSKWMEDPDYHEEIIIREMDSGNIIDRKPGFLVPMPDGTKWMMTR